MSNNKCKIQYFPNVLTRAVFCKVDTHGVNSKEHVPSSFPSSFPSRPQSGRYSALKLEVVGQVAPTSAMRSGSGANISCRLWRQSKDAEAQGAALQLLAPGLLHEMAARLGYHVPLEHLAPSTSTQKEVVEAAMRSGTPQRLTADSLAAIVRRSSIYQAAAGLLAAGGGKAVQYVGSKMAKAVRPLLAMAIPAGGNSAGSKKQGVS
ncbi:hypothetical protein Vafri_3005 [Volvox africanus]|uniref:Phosphatidate cytidylyltransferase, mitochondrial n=1 Tax=Volvox africanus TaxID=51714 RepID=A0A8J4ASA4_9CHLO|nr:hypothetical protein Vafri_3005 [Volvox africanus]